MRTFSMLVVTVAACGSLSACGLGEIDLVPPPPSAAAPPPPSAAAPPPRAAPSEVDVLAGTPAGGFSGDQYLVNELSGVLRRHPGDPVRYADYQTVSDQTGGVTVQVPRAWADVDGRPAGVGGRTIADVRAAPDLAAFEGGWSTPGAVVNATSQLAEGETEAILLDELVGRLSAACDYQGRRPYPSRAYVAFIDLYTDCAGTGAASIVVGAAPPDRSFAVRVRVNVVAMRDLSALDRLLASVKITGRV